VSLKTVAVEQEFRIPLVNPETGAESKTWQLAGKLDGLVRDEQGRLFVLEHKTSSADIGPGSDYIARLRLDGQVSMYLRAAREMGHGEPAGVLYDVIGKVALRPYKKSAEIKLKKDGTPYANCRLEDETPDEYRARVAEHIAANPDDYFQRVTVVRLEDELREFERELWQMGSIMRDAVRTGIAPRNPDACSRYGSMCSFWPVCSGETSQDSYPRGAAHSELAAPDVGLPLLTHSRLQAYRRCPREEQLRYQKGLQPPQTEAMRFGTLMHLGLEAWWKADPAERLAAAMAVVAGEGADAYDQARVEALLLGYDARWNEAETHQAYAAVGG
jgi:hypothetical protein